MGFWHKMADEQPTDEDGKYLLLGNRGAMYLANGYSITSGGTRHFYIPNNRSSFMEFDKVKAWAEVPEYLESE